MTRAPTQEFQPHDGIQLATQAGPMLVIAGQVHPAFREGSSNRFIRCGVGIAPNQSVIFAISDQPVNFHDFAILFREHLGCRDALCLDGAISRFLTPNPRPITTASLPAS
jgi:uncharacterized protein YigE (DUF2233 family)